MLSQSTGTIGSACDHMRDCFMKMLRSSTTVSVFTGFSLLTMTTNGTIWVDACPVHNRTINAAVRISTRHAKSEEENRRGRQAVERLLLPFHMDEIAFERLRPEQLGLERNLRVRPVIQSAKMYRRSALRIRGLTSCSTRQNTIQSSSIRSAGCR